MNTPVSQPQPQTENVSHFGSCPECGSEGECLNIRKEHWFFCEEHRVKWHVGYNLFSSWMWQDDATWEANRAFLADFREVEG